MANPITWKSVAAPSQASAFDMMNQSLQGIQKNLLGLGGIAQEQADIQNAAVLNNALAQVQRLGNVDAVRQAMNGSRFIDSLGLNAEQQLKARAALENRLGQVTGLENAAMQREDMLLNRREEAIQDKIAKLVGQNKYSGAITEAGNLKYGGDEIADIRQKQTQFNDDNILSQIEQNMANGIFGNDELISQLSKGKQGAVSTQVKNARIAEEKRLLEEAQAKAGRDAMSTFMSGIQQRNSTFNWNSQVSDEILTQPAYGKNLNEWYVKNPTTGMLTLNANIKPEDKEDALAYLGQLQSYYDVKAPRGIDSIFQKAIGKVDSNLTANDLASLFATLNSLKANDAPSIYQNTVVKNQNDVKAKLLENEIANLEQFVGTRDTLTDSTQASDIFTEYEDKYVPSGDGGFLGETFNYAGNAEDFRREANAGLLSARKAIAKELNVPLAQVTIPSGTIIRRALDEQEQVQEAKAGRQGNLGGWFDNIEADEFANSILKFYNEYKEKEKTWDIIDEKKRKLIETIGGAEMMGKTPR